MHGWKRAEPGVARRAQPRLRAAAKAEMGAFYPLLLLRSLEAERPDAGGQAVALAALAPLVAQPQLLARAPPALQPARQGCEGRGAPRALHRTACACHAAACMFSRGHNIPWRVSARSARGMIERGMD